jgi:uncharacterized protein (DUF1800 family)
MTDALASQIAHLYRRAGFSATQAEVQAGVARGYSETVDHLLDPTRVDTAVVADPAVDYSTSGPAVTIEEKKAKNKLRNQQQELLADWWLEKMAATDRPATEKLTLFWHDHFATSVDKVKAAILMFEQNKTLRNLGTGRFEALAQAMAKDGAMMIWLDSNQNTNKKPNENFGRELMELFTIGIGSYTDNDVREAARAFAGWRFNPKGGFALAPKLVDTGSKTILGQTGALTGEQVVSLLSNSPATARFITAKMWRFYAFPAASDHPAIVELSGAFARDFDLAKLHRAIFLHPSFQSTEARQGLVKQPVEWGVGVCRQLGVRPSALGIRPRLALGLRQMNQEVFAPPSVGGWPDNNYWISTASALSRMTMAFNISGAVDLSWLSSVAAAQRPDALAAKLTVDGWSASTLGAIRVANNPRNQLAAALTSPEYVLN